MFMVVKETGPSAPPLLVDVVDDESELHRAIVRHEFRQVVEELGAREADDDQVFSTVEREVLARVGRNYDRYRILPAGTEATVAAGLR